MVTHFIQWHATLSSGTVSNKRSYLVGKYEVQLNSFENTALPTLRIPKNAQVLIRHTRTCIFKFYSTLFLLYRDFEKVNSNKIRSTLENVINYIQIHIYI